MFFGNRFNVDHRCNFIGFRTCRTSTSLHVFHSLHHNDGNLLEDFCFCLSNAFFFFKLGYINRRKSGHDYLIGSRTVWRKKKFVFLSFVLIQLWKAHPNKKNTKKEDENEEDDEMILLISFAFTNKEKKTKSENKEEKKKKQRRKHT